MYKITYRGGAVNMYWYRCTWIELYHTTDQSGCPPLACFVPLIAPNDLCQFWITHVANILEQICFPCISEATMLIC